MDLMDFDGFSRIKALERENAELKQKLTLLESQARSGSLSCSAPALISENEERIRTMFEHTGDGILLVDLATWTISYANETFCNMLEIPVQEATGMDLRRVHSEELLASIDSLFQNAETGKVELLENIFLHRKNGSTFYVDIQLTFLCVAGADFLMADFRDVTEHRRAEEELKLNEMRLNSLLELSQKAHRLSRQEITYTALEGSIRLTRSEFGYIYLKTLSGQSMEFTADAGQNHPAHTAQEIRSLLEQDRLWKNCLESQQALIKNNYHGVLDGKGDSLPVSRLVVAPIFDKKDITLVVVVANKEEEYSETDLIQLRLIGYQLIRILARKQAEVELQRYAREQAALYAITSAASRFLDPDDLLATSLDLTLNLTGLGADAGWMILLEEWPQNTPRLVARQGCPGAISQEQLINWLQSCKICALLLDNQEPSPNTVPATPCPNPAFPCLGSHDLKCHIAFPIRTGKRNLGIMILGWRTPVPFVATDFTLLTAIGRQIGLALRNAQLYQAAAQTNRLKVLNALSTAASSSLEMDVVLKQVLEMTCNAVRASSGSILQTDASQSFLTFSRTFGENSEILLGQQIPMGRGVAGWVAQHRQIVCINDVHQDPRWFEDFDEQSHFVTRSMLCAPLVYHGTLTGVIEVINKRNEGFTQEDVSLLESVAAIISVAMENARYFASTRARAQELETLIQIGLGLNSTLDFASIVRNALTQIQHLFQNESVALFRLEELARDTVSVHALMEQRFVELSRRLSCGKNSALDWVLEQREALLIRDTSKLPAFHESSTELLLGFTQGSMILSPMHTNNKLAGILLVASNEVDHFTEQNLHTLQAVSATLNVALENARLYENLKTLLRERELAQEKMVQTAKMAALGRLSASLAHEINNPLQAMQGCLTLFSEEMNEAGRKDKLEHYMAIVQDELERITTIVNRMKDYYRPDRDGMQTVDPQSILEVVLDLTAKQLQQNLLVVRRDWPNQPIQIEASQNRLKQVFLNLVLNAMDAMPNGGTLTISIRMDRIERARGLPAAAVRIDFIDTGIGMTPEIQANIFEPFFSTKESGSGLGLYVVYGIIQAHQGELHVSSKPGIGTTFSILLPLAQT